MCSLLGASWDQSPEVSRLPGSDTGREGSIHLVVHTRWGGLGLQLEALGREASPSALVPSPNNGHFVAEGWGSFLFWHLLLLSIPSPFSRNWVSDSRLSSVSAAALGT